MASNGVSFSHVTSSKRTKKLYRLLVTDKGMVVICKWTKIGVEIKSLMKLDTFTLAFKVDYDFT